MVFDEFLGKYAFNWVLKDRELLTRFSEGGILFQTMKILRENVLK